jgi:hypothetical protein
MNSMNYQKGGAAAPNEGRVQKSTSQDPRHFPKARYRLY